MKKLLVLAVLVPAFLSLAGCGKKQEQEELQPITMESLSTPTEAIPVAAPVAPLETKVGTVVETASKEMLPLPPQGPYKPTATEIQTALKNAGFYKGKIDGTLGPKSKKAVEDFQSANGLKIDGRVGPKTWEFLSKYLVKPEKARR